MPCRSDEMEIRLGSETVGCAGIRGGLFEGVSLHRLFRWNGTHVRYGFLTGYLG